MTKYLQLFPSREKRMLLKHVDPDYFTKELAVDDPHTQTLIIRMNNDMLLTLPYFL